MKKIVILLFAFWGLITCSTTKNAKEDESISNNVDSLILQPSTQQPIIDRIQHASHSSHSSHFSHISHYSSL